jgi:hypothetical protein
MCGPMQRHASLFAISNIISLIRSCGDSTATVNNGGTAQPTAPMRYFERQKWPPMECSREFWQGGKFGSWQNPHFAGFRISELLYAGAHINPRHDAGRSLLSAKSVLRSRERGNRPLTSAMTPNELIPGGALSEIPPARRYGGAGQCGGRGSWLIVVDYRRWCVMGERTHEIS